jgi:hypothetical protein
VTVHRGACRCPDDLYVQIGHLFTKPATIRVDHVAFQNTWRTASMKLKEGDPIVDTSIFEKGSRNADKTIRWCT